MEYAKISQKEMKSKFPQNDLLENFPQNVFNVPLTAVYNNGVTNVVPTVGKKTGAKPTSFKLDNGAIVNCTETANGNLTMFPLTSVDGKVTRWVSIAFVDDLIASGAIKDEHLQDRPIQKTKSTVECTFEATSTKPLQISIELERTDSGLVIGSLVKPTAKVEAKQEEVAAPF